MSDGRPDPRLTGRAGGLRAWAVGDPAAMLGPAHRGFRARFENQVVAAAAAKGRELTPQEIAVRADRACRAYMLLLAAKSAQARRRRRAALPHPPGPPR